VSRAVAFPAAFLLSGCLLASSPYAAAVEIKGTSPCSKWTEEKRYADSAKELNRVPALITRSWFLGYVSGRASATGKDFLKGTDSDSIFLWLDNYCRAHPKAELDQAGDDLARELMQLKDIRP
jgi:hypothetical protein